MMDIKCRGGKNSNLKSVQHLVPCTVSQPTFLCHHNSPKAFVEEDVFLKSSMGVWGFYISWAKKILASILTVINIVFSVVLITISLKWFVNNWVKQPLKGSIAFFQWSHTTHYKLSIKSFCVTYYHMKYFILTQASSGHIVSDCREPNTN